MSSLIFCLLVAISIKNIISNPIVKNDKFIIVKKNSTENEFLIYLNNENIDITKFEWYIAKFLTSHKFILKHGEYLIKKNNTLLDFLENINNNKIFYRKFTLVEGSNAHQLKKKLIKAKGLVGNIPKLYEGIYRPDTYLYKWGDTKISLLKKMEIEQNVIIDKHWKNRKKNKYLKSKLDLIILASIIEKEGKKSEELKKISSVFFNRLEKNMKLQSDVTIAYALNKSGKNLNRSDLKSKNFFNTYRYKGLPPSPICFPSKKALLAALYPYKTDFLYFVSDGKGGHKFSKTFSEHKKNVKSWIKAISKNEK